MNIEQVKKDLEEGIQVSKFTLLKLAEAALIMQDTLMAISSGDRFTKGPASDAVEAINSVKRL